MIVEYMLHLCVIQDCNYPLVDFGEHCVFFLFDRLDACMIAMHVSDIVQSFLLFPCSILSS